MNFCSFPGTRAIVLGVSLVFGLSCAHNENNGSASSAEASRTMTLESLEMAPDAKPATRSAPGAVEALTAEDGAVAVDHSRICAFEQPFPYASGSAYVGLHANRENNNRVYCPGGSSYERVWAASPVLKGHMVFQPLSISADGTRVYAAVARTSGCKFYAIDTQSGEIAWCKGEENTEEYLTLGVSGGTAEVDKDGNVYVTDGFIKPEHTAVYSWTQDGQLRWRTGLAGVGGKLRPGYLAPAGLHFTPEGYAATVTPAGVIALLRMDTGEVLTFFDIPKETGFVPPKGKEGYSFKWLPRGLMKKVEAVIGEMSPAELKVVMGASTGGTGASFSDNTLGITVNNQILVVGGGPNEDDGSLVALDVLRDGDRPVLKLRWYAVIEGGSATSPAISKDGTRAVVGDGNSGVVYVRIDHCNDNSDGDPKPDVCKPSWVYPLLGKSLLGSAAMDENGVVYCWNSSQKAEDVDLFTLEDVEGSPRVGWEASYAEQGGPNLQWTSIATVMDNQVIGTITTIRKAIKAGAGALMIDLSHEIIGVARYSGEVLWRLPIPDDSINSPAVGPDGSLYIPLLGILDLTSPNRKVGYEGGIIKYRPIYKD